MVDPTGQTSVHLDALRTLIAGSETFQEWTELATETLAKDRVFIESFVPEEALESLRPFALLGISTRTDTREAVSTFISDQSYQLAFEANVPLSLVDDPMGAGYDFMNNLDAVIAEVEAASSDTIMLKSINMTIAPTRSNSKTGQFDDYFYAVFSVALGL